MYFYVITIFKYFYVYFIKIFCLSNKSIVNLKLEHENVRIRSLNNICSVYCYSEIKISQFFKHTGIISNTPRQRRGVAYLYAGFARAFISFNVIPMPFFL